MSNFTLINDSAAVELFYHIYFAHICFIYSRWRPLQSSTVKYITPFTVFRIIGCAALITMDLTSATTKSHIIMAGPFSLPWLLLAALDIISQECFHMLNLALDDPFRLFAVRVARLLAAAVFTLYLIGVLSASTAANIANQGVAQTGVVIYLIVLILLTFEVAYTNNHHRAETELYPFILPFLLAFLALFLSVMTNIVLLCLFCP